jgi:hypothetical protein
MAGIAIISSLLLLRSVSPPREMVNNPKWKSRGTSN